VDVHDLFDPAMGDAIAAIMGGCKAILLGGTTYEEFSPAWSTRSPWSPAGGCSQMAPRPSNSP